MKTKTLIKTLHGSHLYGLSTPESDVDYYEVYRFLNQRYRPKKLAQQNISDNIDSFRVERDRFHNFCIKGVPQAIEVLYAPEDAIIYADEEWYSFVDLIKEDVLNNLSEVLETYKRTALNFWKDDQKKKRHAYRLLCNAEQLRFTGRMDARLSEENIAAVNFYVNSYDSEDRFKDLVWRILG